MYHVTNPKTGKTYTFGRKNLRRANELASKFGVSVVSHSVFRHRDGTTTPVVAELPWTGGLSFPERCPHGGTVGYCDRGACDE